MHRRPPIFIKHVSRWALDAAVTAVGGIVFQIEAVIPAAAPPLIPGIRGAALGGPVAICRPTRQSPRRADTVATIAKCPCSAVVAALSAVCAIALQVKA